MSYPTLALIDLAEETGPLSWMDRAACAGIDVELFFPSQGVDAKAAKAICGGCEVRGQCLEYALSLPWDEDWGLWGGISMHERRKMRTRRTAQGIGPAVSWCKKKLHVRTEATTYTGPDGRIECRPCKHAGYLRRKIAQKEAA